MASWRARGGGGRGEAIGELTCARSHMGEGGSPGGTGGGLARTLPRVRRRMKGASWRMHSRVRRRVMGGVGGELSRALQRTWRRMTGEGKLRAEQGHAIRTSRSYNWILYRWFWDSIVQCVVAAPYVITSFCSHTMGWLSWLLLGVTVSKGRAYVVVHMEHGRLVGAMLGWRAQIVEASFVRGWLAPGCDATEHVAQVWDAALGKMDDHQGEVCGGMRGSHVRDDGPHDGMQMR